jgi:type VI secretion system protein ImpB
MSETNEGTVAPRERVNIVYRPAVGDAKADVELPLKLLVAGDFKGAPDERSLEQREPVNVDKTNLNDVLKGQDVRLQVTVPDRLSGKPDAQIDARLSFATMDDFTPAGVAAQVPELKALLELREALASLKGPLANLPDFRAKLQNLVRDPETRRKILTEMGLSAEGGQS